MTESQQWNYRLHNGLFRNPPLSMVVIVAAKIIVCVGEDDGYFSMIRTH